MFVKASWIAIVAALCVAQTHGAQAAKPANAVTGTSTLLHDANGKAIGSAANWYDKNGTFISSETTYFSNAPAAAPAVAAEANKSADPPTTYAYATSTAINDANGKPIGESAKYMDKDGKEIFSKTIYYSNAPAAAPPVSAAPAAAPAVAAVANKSADPPTTYAVAMSTAINDANGKPIGESAKYMDKDGKVIFSKTIYYSNAPAAAPPVSAAPAAAPAVAAVANKSADPPTTYAVAMSTAINDANGKPIGESAKYMDKDGKVIFSKTIYYSNAPAAAPPVSAAPAAAPAVAAVANKSADPPTTYAYATSTAINDANGKPIGESAKYMDKDGKVIFSKTIYYSNAPAAAPPVSAAPAAAPAAVREADADTAGTVQAHQ